ncbi:glycosyltransferase family 2 protein [Paenibacillus spongiae]|uniref:Glycosyltransferase n=1 Tax=Paenibacillus spongiae TaxID=2909671 RepID=A0ABY5SC54_9BACL|nr:glycosyltransferase [Paenibacillus spongiae]UVI31531.1 glycosyltransferase [Paenibacillus spongiae]
MSIKVSVVIPVFNSEKFLVPCIESLLNQTLKDCEFLFVNDGSQDNSQSIIETYMQADNRIKLINQANQGVSTARNTGLAASLGEYVGFVDADDTVEPDMYAVLYRAAKQDNCDVVISNFESEMEGHKVTVAYTFPTDTKLNRSFIEQEIMIHFIKEENLNSVCNKLFRNSVIQENSLQFPDAVALGEDERFNIRFFSLANTMKYINYTGYHYREVAGSATRDILTKDYFGRALEAYKRENPELAALQIDPYRISSLRSIKLMNSVMSFIYMYFKPTAEVGFFKRYGYVRRMINDPHVRNALPIYYKEVYESLGMYHRFMFSMIKRRFTPGLYFAAAYSRLRSSK